MYITRGEYSEPNTERAFKNCHENVTEDEEKGKFQLL